MTFRYDSAFASRPARGVRAPAPRRDARRPDAVHATRTGSSGCGSCRRRCSTHPPRISIRTRPARGGPAPRSSLVAPRRWCLPEEAGRPTRDTCAAGGHHRGDRAERSSSSSRGAARRRLQALPRTGRRRSHAAGTGRPAHAVRDPAARRHGDPARDRRLEHPRGLPGDGALARTLLASGAVSRSSSASRSRRRSRTSAPAILLGWSQPVRLGDRVTVADVTGTAVEITLMQTVLVTDEGRRVFVPNSQMATRSSPTGRSTTRGGVVSVRLPIAISAPVEDARTRSARGSRGARGRRLEDVELLVDRRDGVDGVARAQRPRFRPRRGDLGRPPTSASGRSPRSSAGKLLPALAVPGTETGARQVPGTVNGLYSAWHLSVTAPYQCLTLRRHCSALSVRDTGARCPASASLPARRARSTSATR